MAYCSHADYDLGLPFDSFTAACRIKKWAELPRSAPGPFPGHDCAMKALLTVQGADGYELEPLLMEDTPFTAHIMGEGGRASAAH